MNKKIIISSLILIILLGGLWFFIRSDDKVEILDDNNSNINEGKRDEEMEHKSLVLYFSATGTTKKVAELIKEETKSDMIEIIPMDKYTSEDLNYNNDNSRANKEQNDKEARPEIENDIKIDDYDVIYLGYPIWWGDIPKIILTLLENNNFQNKTIIPFCTSGGSGIEESIVTLKSYNLNVMAGRRFSSGTSKSEINSWLESLNIR